jgi:hypothetical protein
MTATGLIGRLASCQLAVNDWRVLKDPVYRPPCTINRVGATAAALETHRMLLTAWCYVIALLVVTRFRPYRSSAP